ncbi:hypothetical protein BH24ACT21_BH24ACT21_12250 [soil metagenome]
MALRQDDKIFQNAQPPNDKSGTKIYSKNFLTPEFCENATDNERDTEIHRCWTEFLEEDLPRIDAALKQESWIWQESGDSE